MCFEYGVGDILAVAQRAWQVYKSCKDAPESFSNIQYEELSLHAVLKEIEEMMSDQKVVDSRKQRFTTILAGCQAVLKDLQALIEKTQSSSDLKYNASYSIHKYITITFEKQLTKLILEFQEGKHEGSVLTVATIESLSTNDKETWRLIRKEFEAIGISVATFEVNKDFIVNWFQEALKTGAFEEQDSINNQDERRIDTTLLVDWTGSNESQTPQIPSRSRSSIITESYVGTSIQPQDDARILNIHKPQPLPHKKRLPSRFATLWSVFKSHEGKFHEHCELGDLRQAQELLEWGVDINCLQYGATAFYHAVGQGKQDVVRFLWNTGADIELCGTQDRTDKQNIWAALYESIIKEPRGCLPESYMFLKAELLGDS